MTVIRQFVPYEPSSAACVAALALVWPSWLGCSRPQGARLSQRASARPGTDLPQPAQGQAATACYRPLRAPRPLRDSGVPRLEDRRITMLPNEYQILVRRG